MLKKICLLAVFACTVHSAFALDKLNGVYQIATAADLKAFADIVNGGESSANAVLTADITGYSGAEDYCIGQPSLTGAYSGTFDGQCHSITYTLTNTRGNAGLFRYVNGGTIKNLIVKGTITMTGQGVGGTVVGAFFQKCITMENVVSYAKIDASGITGSDATAGGLIGCAENKIVDNGTTIQAATISATKSGEIKNCAFYGEIAASGKTGNCGIMGYSNISGSNNPKITNCIVYCTVATGGTNGDICRSPLCTVTNCSTESSNWNTFSSGRKGTSCTTDQIKSGEIAYKLNGSTDDGVWHQIVGVDKYPLPFGTDATRVYKSGTSYLNRANLALDVYFPDAVFRSNVKTMFDTNSNGYIDDDGTTTSEWYKLTHTTDVGTNLTDATSAGNTTNRIQDFTGIEYFASATKITAKYSLATSIDLSRNTNCTQIDLRNNTALTSLNVSGCGITKVNASTNNTAANYLTLYGSVANLTELNISGTKIADGTTTSIAGTFSALETLNASNCTAMTGAFTALTLANYPKLKHIDISNCAGITSFTRNGTNSSTRCTTETLNVSGCTSLTTLTANYGNIHTLSLNGCTALTTIEAQYNSLSTIDVSTCTALARLSLTGNPSITSLDLSNNGKLQELTAKGVGSKPGMLSRLTLPTAHTVAFTSFQIDYNKILALDLSNYTFGGSNAGQFLVNLQRDTLTAVNLNGKTGVEVPSSFGDVSRVSDVKIDGTATSDYNVATVDGKKYLVVATGVYDAQKWNGNTKGVIEYKYDTKINSSTSGVADKKLEVRIVTKADDNIFTTISLDENADNSGFLTGSNMIVEFNRTTVANTWNTLCVPFSLTAAQVETIFGSGTRVAAFKSQTQGTLRFEEVTAKTVEAGVPYLIKPTQSLSGTTTISGVTVSNVAAGRVAYGSTCAFVGIYNPTVIPEKDYFIAAGNQLKHNNDGSALRAFRAYIEVSGSSSAKLTSYSVDDSTTGIGERIEFQPETSLPVYTLQGQCVGNSGDLRRLPAGIYIVGGQKFIVK